MNSIFNKLIIAFWIADLMNMPFMEMFDTTYPLNSLFYFCVFSLWLLLPSINEGFKETKRGESDD